MPACKLCNSDDLSSIVCDRQRQYYECKQCGIITLDPSQVLGAEQEKARYLLHKNSEEGHEYKEYLKKLLIPLTEKLDKPMSGLDYGCGHTPATSAIMRAAGFEMEDYDPFFSPKNFQSSESYDFITCIEVAEHFKDPRKEFDRLSSLLKVNAWLAVRTQTYSAKMDFCSWWYRRDSTHISFYQEKTLAWIAGKYDWKLEKLPDNMFLFKKEEPAALFV